VRYEGRYERKGVSCHRQQFLAIKEGGNVVLLQLETSACMRGIGIALCCLQ